VVDSIQHYLEQFIENLDEFDPLLLTFLASSLSHPLILHSPTLLAIILWCIQAVSTHPFDDSTLPFLEIVCSFLSHPNPSLKESCIAILRNAIADPAARPVLFALNAPAIVLQELLAIPREHEGAICAFLNFLGFAIHEFVCNKTEFPLSRDFVVAVVDFAIDLIESCQTYSECIGLCLGIIADVLHKNSFVKFAFARGLPDLLMSKCVSGRNCVPSYFVAWMEILGRLGEVECDRFRPEFFEVLTEFVTIACDFELVGAFGLLNHLVRIYCREIVEGGIFQTVVEKFSDLGFEMQKAASEFVLRVCQSVPPDVRREILAPESRDIVMRTFEIDDWGIIEEGARLLLRIQAEDFELWNDAFEPQEFARFLEDLIENCQNPAVRSSLISCAERLFPEPAELEM
jgi:hypothetical protein